MAKSLDKNTLPPIPYKSALVDKNGLLSTPWAQWFRQLFVRTGGHVALTNTELQTQVENIPGIQGNVSGNSDTLTYLATQIDDINQGPYL